MSKVIIYIYLLLLLMLIHYNASSQIMYNNENENLKITNQVYYFEDKTHTLSINQVIKKDSFFLVEKSTPNFGIIKSPIWLKITIKNTSKTDKLILQINQPIIDEIEFYSYDSSMKKFDVIRLGEMQSFNFRKYLTPEYLFDIDIPLNYGKTFYIKLNCKENMQVPMLIGTPTSLFNQCVISNVAGGIYMGIMLVMILYNLFIYRIFKDKSYILYSIYITLTMLTQASLQGYTFQLLWPNLPWLAVYSSFLFPSLVSLAGLEFFKEFLRLKERNPKAYYFSFFFFIPYSLSIILSFIGLYKMSFMLMEITSSIVSVFMLYIAYKIYKRGFSEARYFLIGWSIFLIGVCIYVLKDFGILPYNVFTRYTMHFGTAAEVILLSFALADRINILKKEKEQSQTTALLALQENEKLIIEQNVVLEHKVEERTTELKHTNDELNTTLSNLKNTQAQLVNVEKMASLGQLTAGIAHEINNPINFVSANIKPLKMDFDDVFELIKKYESITTEVNLADKLKEIESYKAQINLTYLLTEIESLISVIDDGAKRTAEIVAGLKNFSRLDESDIKTVNINEGIQSTLLLLKSVIPRNTTVITDLGSIPKIECLPGKLNQVFMNLLINAIYAINKKKTEEENTLTIRTYELNEHIYISIEDTGIGMTEDVKAKVFEPFFTTKGVGEGTGLGMSIVFKIIESHQAKIEIESELGVGTKIIIILNKRIDNYLAT